MCNLLSKEGCYAQYLFYHHLEDAFILKNDEAPMLCRKPCQILREILLSKTQALPSRTLLFQVWSQDQQQRTIWELVRNAGSQAPPHPRPPESYLDFNKMPR